MGYAKEISGARKDVADAQLALKRAEQDERVARFNAEKRAIDAVGGEKALGSNDDARKRALAIALANDLEYGKTSNLLWDIGSDLSAKQWRLDSLLDERREWEYGIREKQASALLSRGYPLYEDADTPVKDAAFDVAADSAIDLALAAAPLAVEPAPLNPNDELFDIPF